MYRTKIMQLSLLVYFNIRKNLAHFLKLSLLLSGGWRVSSNLRVVWVRSDRRPHVASRRRWYVGYSLSASQIKLSISSGTTPCLKKTVQNCFCHTFVKFPPTLIVFGRLIAQRINLCDVHLFFTSPNSRQRLTVLNADVPNCYITL